MECERVRDVTPHQQSELDRLQLVGDATAKHLRATFPHEIAWRTLEKAWNRQVFLGTHPNRATFDVRTGCVTIGIPHDAARTDRPLLNARFLLALSKGAAGGKACTDVHAAIVSAATSMGVAVALGCGDCAEHGMCDAAKCPKCEWRGGAPRECQARSSWPELVGMPARRVATLFPADKRVELVTWDMLHHKPAAPDVVRVTYDARTGLVVDPAPHVGLVNVPDFEGSCFIKADEGLRCIGAPLSAPPEWRRLVGASLPDAIDSLRVRYVHATIEAVPSTASVASDLRPDRIRVWFDPSTAKVDRVPTVG
jgi:hypothetical protein